MEIMRAQKILEILDDYNAVQIQSMQELLDFSDEFQSIIENSPNKPPYECSIIDLIGGVTEPVTSQIIKLIFQYKDVNKNSSAVVRQTREQTLFPCLQRPKPSAAANVR